MVGSIKHSIPAYWITRKIARAAFCPFICLVGMEFLYQKAEPLAHSFWKISNWKPSSKLAEMIFTEKDFALCMQLIFVFNFFGSFSLRRVIKLGLNFILGANIIGRKLSQLISNLDRDLTVEEIKTAVKDFKDASEKEMLAQAIDKRLNDLVDIDYKAHDRDQKVLEIATEVVDEVFHYNDKSIFQEERVRLIKDMRYKI
jgi:hypothetical protein